MNLVTEKYETLVSDIKATLKKISLPEHTHFPAETLKKRLEMWNDVLWDDKTKATLGLLSGDQKFYLITTLLTSEKFVPANVFYSLLDNTIDYTAQEPNSHQPRGLWLLDQLTECFDREDSYHYDSGYDNLLSGFINWGFYPTNNPALLNRCCILGMAQSVEYLVKKNTYQAKDLEEAFFNCIGNSESTLRIAPFLLDCGVNLSTHHANTHQKVGDIAARNALQGRYIEFIDLIAVNGYVLSPPVRAKWREAVSTYFKNSLSRTGDPTPVIDTLWRKCAFLLDTMDAVDLKKQRSVRAAFKNTKRHEKHVLNAQTRAQAETRTIALSTPHKFKLKGSR